MLFVCIKIKYTYESVRSSLLFPADMKKNLFVMSCKCSARYYCHLFHIVTVSPLTMVFVLNFYVYHQSCSSN